MIWNNYPYTDFHEMNLDWIIKKIKEITKEVSDFKVVNRIVWGGLHDPGKEYPRWCIVDTPTHEGYISIQPVPAGITIDNEDYWRQVANYSALYADFQNRIINCENNIISLDERTSDLEDFNYLHGKKVLIIGDSISDENLFPNNWVNSFRSLVDSTTTITNVSLSGKTIGTISGETNNLTATLSAVTGSYDIILVYLGVNDWARQVPLGQFNLGLSTDNICGALLNLATWKSTNYPSTKLTIVTPLKSVKSGFTGHKLLQMYSACICANALWFGWQCIDAHSFAPIYNPSDSQQWTSDGIHPSDSYSPIFASYIYNQLSREVSTIGTNYSTYLGIGDVNGAANKVIAHIDAGGALSYEVDGFSITSSGNFKLADIPEECLPKDNAAQAGMLLRADGTTCVVVLNMVSASLYAYIPTGETGTLYANMGGMSVRYVGNLVNGSF